MFHLIESRKRKIMDLEEKTLFRKRIFKGKIIDVEFDKVVLPNELGMSTRELVFHPGGVAVLAITDERKIVMVQQFRKAIEQVIYEVPAGKLEEGEKSDLTSAILREMEEEIGLTTTNIQQIAEFYVSPGFTNEKTYLFLAQDLVEVPTPKPKDPDELLEIHELTLNEAKELIKTGEISDAKTIIALQYYELKGLQNAQTNFDR